MSQRGRGYDGVVVKHALVFALVVVVLFTGVPIVMGMPAMDCAECDFAVVLIGTCLPAVLTAVGFALLLLAVRFREPTVILASLLAASGLDRPPRLA